MQKGIEHSCYPYVDINHRAGSEEAAYLLYQQDIRDMGGAEGMDIETIDIRQNQAASQTILDMEILDGEDGLQLMIDYTASLYDESKGYLHQRRAGSGDPQLPDGRDRRRAQKKIHRQNHIL